MRIFLSARTTHSAKNEGKLMRSLICSVLLILLGSGFENARAAPAQTLNKTVTVSWSSFVPANCSNGTTNQTARDVTQQIYISTQGRLFAKVAARAGRASKDWSAAPSASGQFRFSGDRLVGTFPQASGAAQMTISFDASYQTCNVAVAHGRESGKPYVWVNLVGATCTATGKATVSSLSCSVSPGNAFAN